MRQIPYVFTYWRIFLHYNGFDGNMCISYAMAFAQEVALWLSPWWQPGWGHLPVCPEGGMRQVQVHDLWGSKTELPVHRITEWIKGFSCILPNGFVPLQKWSSLWQTVPFDVSAPFRATAVTSASLTHWCFLCHFAPRLPSLLPKFFLRLKRNLPFTLSKVCPNVFGKRFILKSANSLFRKRKRYFCWHGFRLKFSPNCSWCLIWIEFQA